MKTKRLLFAILAVSALVLSGCKDNNENNPYPTQKELINSAWEYKYEYEEEDWFVPVGETSKTTTYTYTYSVSIKSESDYTLVYNYYVDQELKNEKTIEGTYAYNEAKGIITADYDTESISASFSNKEKMFVQIGQNTYTFVKK